jgi:MFS family permease
MLSEVGDWIGLLGIAALLYAKTGQAVFSAASLAALYLPYLFAPWLVSWCARIPPRTLLIGADFMRAGLILMLLLPLPIWALLALTFLASVPTSVYEATRAAAVPEYAPDESTQDDALALFQSTQQAATMFGFLVGGAALAFVGYQAAIILNAASFILSALIIFGVPSLPPFASHKSAKLLTRAGLDALRGQIVLRRSVVLSVVSASMIMAGEALVVVYGSEIGHEGLAGPLAAATAAVAAVVGLLLPRHLNSVNLLRVSQIAMVVGGVIALVAFLVVPGIFSGFTGYIALGVISAPGALMYIVAVREMGPAVRAPVFAVVQVGLMCGQGAVALLAGILADQMGVGLAIALCQIPTVVLSVLWLLPSADLRRRHAEDPPPVEAPVSSTPDATPEADVGHELPAPSAAPVASQRPGVREKPALPATR